MKKSLLFVCALAMLAGVAFWAYRVNYTTQDSMNRVASLHAQIAREREALSVLRAEWAYLNAPDRLRRLADAHFEELGLIPISPAHFESPEKIAYPPHRITVVADGIEYTVSILDHVKLGVPLPAPRPGDETAIEIQPDDEVVTVAEAVAKVVAGESR